MKSQQRRLQVFYDAWFLIKPYWVSKHKFTGFILLGLILICNIVNVYMSVWLNEWNGRFYNTIQSYDKEGFFHTLIQGFVIMSLYVFVMILSYYVSSVLEIKWRKWLTSYYLQEWFTSKAYYSGRFAQHKQDNPDQRISEDIHQFVQLTLRMFVNFFSSTLTLGSFIIILWGFSGAFKFNISGHQFYIPGYMVWIAVIYALLGTYITFKIGNPLIRINFKQQKYEADFRYNLVRVREYSEQIASYNAATAEQKIITQDFDNIVDNFIQSVHRNLKINLFNYAYGQLSDVVPTVVSASRYFAKEITLGNMMQINSAFGRVQFSIAYFIYIYNDIANLKAIMDRMIGFNHMVNVAKNINTINQNLEHKPYLIIKDLNICLPNGQQIINNFSLSINQGERVLITGVSGSGKSTLFKTINGLWYYANGIISEKKGLHSLFISQKPYFPKLNLKEAICYPKVHNLPSDEEIKEILRQCDLATLTNLLYDNHDWGNYLSLGEQQKIIFCRILVNDPDIIYLDEITSSLDENSETRLYQLLFEKLPDSAIISIAHRSSLLILHSNIIKL